MYVCLAAEKIGGTVKKGAEVFNFRWSFKNVALDVVVVNLLCSIALQLNSILVHRTKITYFDDCIN